MRLDNKLGQWLSKLFDIHHPTHHWWWRLDDKFLIDSTKFITGNQLELITAVGTKLNKQWNDGCKAALTSRSSNDTKSLKKFFICKHNSKNIREDKFHFSGYSILIFQSLIQLWNCVDTIWKLEPIGKKITPYLLGLFHTLPSTFLKKIPNFFSMQN